MADDSAAVVTKFLRDLSESGLPEAEQAKYKQAFFQKKIVPSDEWQQADNQLRRGLASTFGMPAGHGALYNREEIKEAPGVLGRIVGRAGGYPDASQRSQSPWLSGLGAAGTTLNLPGAALGEAVDAATGRRPASFGWEMSSPGEAAHGLANLAMATPKGVVGSQPMWRTLIQTPGMLRRLIETLNARIAANYAGAAADIPRTMGRPPLMLPPAGGGTQVPFAMPGGFQKPVPPPFAPRPPELMPKWSKPAMPDLTPPGPID